MEDKRDNMDELRDIIYELIEQMEESQLRALIELARVLISEDISEEDVDISNQDAGSNDAGKDRVLWGKISWSETIKKVEN